MKAFFYLWIIPMVSFGQSNLQDVEQLLEKKQFEKAETFMVNYVKDHPNDLKGIELLGDAYSKRLKWDDAILTYKKLVDAKDSDANYQYKYGGAMGLKALTVSKLKALGMIDDIKEAFLKAAELDPKHIDARWALVKLYMQLPGIAGGSIDKSLMYANQLEKLSKIDGYLAKGYIYEEDNEAGQAEKYYKMAVKEGGSMTSYEHLTNFYEQQKQPQKAIANIEDNYKAHKNNVLQYQIGKVSAENNLELQKGEMYLYSYLKNYSNKDDVPKAWANYRLAQINKHNNNKADALKYINLAIADFPEMKPFMKEKELILKL